MMKTKEEEFKTADFYRNLLSAIADQLRSGGDPVRCFFLARGNDIPEQYRGDDSRTAGYLWKTTIMRTFPDGVELCRKLWPNDIEVELGAQWERIPAHVAAMVSIIDDKSRKPKERFDALIAYKKEHCGLKAFHGTAYPTEGKELSEDKMYEDFLKLERGILTGEIKLECTTNLPL